MIWVYTVVMMMIEPSETAKAVSQCFPFPFNVDKGT